MATEVHVTPPSLDRSMLYPLMLAPPLFVGNAHASVAVVLPPVTVNAVGALAVVNGVAPAEPDVSPAPAALIALTRKVYAVPLVSPFTTTLVPEFAVFAIAVVHVAPASLERSTL